MIYLRDWSWSGESYGNNTGVICCPVQGNHQSAAPRTSLLDKKSWECCCHNSWPTMINPDYNLTKRLCVTCIYDKIWSKSAPNQAMLPTCFHCDTMHLSLMMGVVALYIPLWRVGVHEECSQACKILWSVHAGRVICHYQNGLYGIITHPKHIWDCFWRYKLEV